MKSVMATVGLLLSLSAAHAAVCADGVYRAGCAGPNGGAVVHKPVPAPVVRHPYHPATTCASGPYRAGCAGPNGAAVVRRPY